MFLIKARTENVAMATKYLIFWSSSYFVHKCTKFYLILTSNARTTFDLNIEYKQKSGLLATSQCLLKGHKMLIFYVAFFLKISDTLKAHISGMETGINKR